MFPIQLRDVTVEPSCRSTLPDADLIRDDLVGLTVAVEVSRGHRAANPRLGAPSRKLGRELELRSGDAGEVTIQLEDENAEPSQRLQLGKYRAALPERPSAYPSEALRFESAAEFFFTICDEGFKIRD